MESNGFFSWLIFSHQCHLCSRHEFLDRSCWQRERFWGYGPSDGICDWIVIHENEVRDPWVQIFNSSVIFGSINMIQIGDSLYVTQYDTGHNFH